MLKLIMNLIMKRDWIRINHIAAKTALTRNQNKKSIQRKIIKEMTESNNLIKKRKPKRNLYHFAVVTETVTSNKVGD